jgi:hypothetical protein
MSIDDVWHPLPEELGHTHGWASIPEGIEVEVEVIN